MNPLPGKPDLAGKLLRGGLDIAGATALILDPERKLEPEVLLWGGGVLAPLAYRLQPRRTQIVYLLRKSPKVISQNPGQVSGLKPRVPSVFSPVPSLLEASPLGFQKDRQWEGGVSSPLQES